MKNDKSKKVFVITSLCVVLVAAVFGIAVFARRYSQGSNSQTPSKDRNDMIAIRDALRRGGLREAAKIKGHYVQEFDPHWDHGLFDVEALTKNSTAVVVGRVKDKVASRIAGVDGNLIFTDYEIVVEESIKGTVPRDASITVSLPGGRVDFEDGTSAELTTPTFEHVKKDEIYTFFLNEGPTASSPYTLVGGPQGLVQIVNETKVKSKGRSTDPVAKETAAKSKASFLEEVRDKARKYPQPGRCCS